MDFIRKIQKDKNLKLTTFASDFTSSKVPKSPFGDKTFEFKSHEVSLPEALELIRNEFVLNRNYDFNKTHKLRRTKKDLSPFLSPKLEFVIIDFDNVKNKYNENMIVNFFKERDYCVGIIPSRSYNGIDSFNLKGILKASGFNNKPSIRAILEEINETLFPYTKIDLTSINEGSLQSPPYNDGIILLQNGDYIPNFEIEEYEKEIKQIFTENHQEVVNLCINEFLLRGFSINKIDSEKDLIVFSHPSEKTPNGYFLFVGNPFFMNHFNKDKSFSIFDSLKGKKVFQEFFSMKEKNQRIVEFQGTGVSDFTKIINTRYIDVDEIGVDFIDNWITSSGLLKLKSAMGTGKSKVIEKAIECGTIKNQRILLITNRISVAMDFKEKYKLKLYSDGKYEINDNLIVQFDSLWKYSLKYFDMIILDEFVSVMLHSRNEMSEYGNLNKTKLMYAMMNKTCLIADAFLFGLEDKLIPTKPKYSIINNYREDLELLEYQNLNSIIHKIREITLEERLIGRKVSVSCSSKASAKAIESLMETLGVKTMLLYSATQEEEKSDIYKEFTKNSHDSWDILIYTPTLTVGVSNLNETKHHFHIDESSSVDVISSLQMIRRSRKATNIHYFIKERKRFLETDMEQMNLIAKNDIEKYYKRNNSLLIEVDKHGDFTLSKVGEFINSIEALYNKLEIDHKHSFELLLKHQVKEKEIKMFNIKTDININLEKTKIKEAEMNSMVGVLFNLTEIEYSVDMLEEYRKRSFLVSEKEKMIKMMSEISKNLVDKVSPEILKEITKIEIQKKFNFLNKLKKLKFYLSKDETEVSNLLSFIISENIVDKGQIKYFKYVQSLKKNGIKLKDKITLVEISEVDKKITWGDFKSFLGKIGYNKRGGAYHLDSINLKYVQFVK